MKSICFIRQRNKSNVNNVFYTSILRYIASKKQSKRMNNLKSYMMADCLRVAQPSRKPPTQTLFGLVRRSSARTSAQRTDHFRSHPCKYGLWPTLTPRLTTPEKFGAKSPLMSRIERRYCFISTSYLAGLFDIFILLHIWPNCACLGDFFRWAHFVMLIMRNLNLISVQSKQDECIMGL